MTNPVLQDTDLWEVWIEYDQFHPEYFGTLYVHGEVIATKGTATLTKIDKAGNQLQLKLPCKTSGPKHTKEVVYSEPVKNLNQYRSVCIYDGDEVINYFNDIEIMI
jgi:hypothetical protein